MAGKEQYSAKQMITALRASRGMITVAARRVGCSYNTMRRYIDKYATVKQAFDEIKQSLGDDIETTLLSQAMGVRDRETGAYIQEPNVTALIFLAKTHPVLRERGYGEKQHIEHSGTLTWAQIVAQAGDDASE